MAQAIPSLNMRFFGLGQKTESGTISYLASMFSFFSYLVNVA